MDFRITGLSPKPFQHLYGLSAERLKASGVSRVAVDVNPGYPDRIELADMRPGQFALLLNYVHQPANTAYRSSHAIFVREGAVTAHVCINAIPNALRIRPLSIRAFDANDEMLDADLIDGRLAQKLIERLFENSGVAYLYAHFAKRGCFAARIDRIATCEPHAAFTSHS